MHDFFSEFVLRFHNIMLHHNLKYLLFVTKFVNHWKFGRFFILLIRVSIGKDQ